MPRNSEEKMGSEKEREKKQDYLTREFRIRLWRVHVGAAGTVSFLSALTYVDGSHPIVQV